MFFQSTLFFLNVYQKDRDFEKIETAENTGRSPKKTISGGERKKLLARSRENGIFPKP